MLADFLSIESSEVVTMHIQSVDQTEAVKKVKHTITELDRSKIEEQKKAVRSGYDMDIIPSDLATYGNDAKALLKELVRLDFQQEQGLMSSLPLAHNEIEIQRAMTTSSTAIFIPFTTQELFQTGTGALYYGLNALSNNLIMVDRKKLKNPNGLILGTPGSGKSFAAKREIANAFLVTDDDIIISDPEAEYSALVRRFDGQVIKIAPTSDQYIKTGILNIRDRKTCRFSRISTMRFYSSRSRRQRMSRRRWKSMCAVRSMSSTTGRTLTSTTASSAMTSRISENS